MPSLAVIGPVPEADLQLLRRQAAVAGLEVVVQAGAAGNPGPVQGYVSYLPCTREVLIDFFGNQPVGMSYKVPFYQHTDSEGDIPSFLEEVPVFGLFRSPISPLEAGNMVRSILRQSRVASQADDLIAEIIKYRKQKHQLITIGAALTSQTNQDSLLALILSQCRDIVAADAGSIYVRERGRPGGPFVDRIRFKISQNDSVDVAEKTREFVLAIDQNTIAGYVAFTGAPLNIDDVYRLDASVPYRFGRDFDQKFGYRMKSMLTVPLKNLGGEVVGVLQLMNKKSEKSARLSSPGVVERTVTSFSLSDLDLILSIASLAAVSIERIQLYESIQQLFEGFLSSSIAAIDERDRVTSGHSRRVMGYAMAYVDAINAATEGPFAAVKFSEERKRQFKFAALLHDIGKIGVPEAVLTKEHKLSRGEMEALMTRMDYVRMQMALSPDQVLSWKDVRELEDDRAFLQKVNQGGFASDQDIQRLAALRGKKYRTTDGTLLPLLSDSQWEALSVRRGNLTEQERQVINSHAQSTRRLLSKIPWNKDLELIPDIACHHHERIDGTGYPDGLKGDDISLESRILSVIDIYEALVAQDRPYKPKMAPEKAIEILRAEAKANHLDPVIVEFFVSSGAYRIFFTSGELSRPSADHACDP